MIINEVVSNSNTIYRWVSERILIDYCDLKVMPAMWTHFIESEDRQVKGISWSREKYRWSLDLAFCLVTDISNIPNKCFEINGQRTFLHTKAISQPKIYDPNAYKLEDGPPDEVFIEGAMHFNSSTIEKVLVRHHKLVTLTKYYSEIEGQLDALKIPHEKMEN